MDLFRTGTETETETVTMDAILESEEIRAVDYECEQESNSQWISERDQQDLRLHAFAVGFELKINAKMRDSQTGSTQHERATRESSSKESSQKHNKQKCQTSVREDERESALGRLSH